MRRGMRPRTRFCRRPNGTQEYFGRARKISVYLPHALFHSDIDRDRKGSIPVQVFEPHDAPPYVVAGLKPIVAGNVGAVVRGGEEELRGYKVDSLFARISHLDSGIFTARRCCNPSVIVSVYVERKWWRINQDKSKQAKLRVCVSVCRGGWGWVGRAILHT